MSFWDVDQSQVPAAVVSLVLLAASVLAQIMYEVALWDARVAHDAAKARRAERVRPIVPDPYDWPDEAIDRLRSAITAESHRLEAERVEDVVATYDPTAEGRPDRF